MKNKKNNLKSAQIMTPPWVTREMIKMIGAEKFADHETYLFEPSCGDGGMLKTCCEEIHKVLLEKYKGDFMKEKAVADLCFKFYAIDIDPKMVIKARHKMYEFFAPLINDCNRDILLEFILARILQAKIECKDFFEVMKGKK